jgi:hypothetical protein
MFPPREGDPVWDGMASRFDEPVSPMSVRRNIEGGAITYSGIAQAVRGLTVDEIAMPLVDGLCLSDPFRVLTGGVTPCSCEG